MLTQLHTATSEDSFLQECKHAVRIKKWSIISIMIPQPWMVTIFDWQEYGACPRMRITASFISDFRGENGNRGGSSVQSGICWCIRSMDYLNNPPVKGYAVTASQLRVQDSSYWYMQASGLPCLQRPAAEGVIVADWPVTGHVHSRIVWSEAMGRS
jgi:hypothetical protein